MSRQVGWRFQVALVLAHETGHRIGAIRELRWPDINFEDRTIRWRAEHEKTGYEHITPLTDEALAALEEARRMNRGTGNAPVLPSPQDARRCIGRVSAHIMVEQGADARGAGSEARQRLALTQTQVRQRPYGHAAQGAL